MNLFAPISSIMTKNLITVNPEDTLLAVDQIFEKNSIHHIPVVRFRKIVGLISKSDFDRFIGGFSKNDQDRFAAASRMNYTTAQDIMTTKLAKLDADDKINVAIEVFCLNRFHALPVLQDEELVGIVTPFDILKQLNTEKPERPESVYA